MGELYVTLHNQCIILSKLKVRYSLIKNRQLPSSIEGIARKLLLLYTGPNLVTQVKGNNTYEIKSITDNKIKAVSYTHLDVYKRQNYKFNNKLL